MNDEASKTADAAKKLFIKTYGCQMNVYDSQRMAEARAVRIIQAPSGRMAPVLSAIGTNRAGPSSPWTGWRQRSSASAPATRPVARVI